MRTLVEKSMDAILSQSQQIFRHIIHEHYLDGTAVHKLHEMEQ